MTTIVIIIIVLIVLAVVVIFFFGQFKTAEEAMQGQSQIVKEAGGEVGKKWGSFQGIFQ